MGLRSLSKLGLSAPLSSAESAVIHAACQTETASVIAASRSQSDTPCRAEVCAQRTPVLLPAEDEVTQEI